MVFLEKTLVGEFYNFYENNWWALKRKKKFFKIFNTRPLKDMVKESLFNIITHSNIVNVKIKDSTY